MKRRRSERARSKSNPSRLETVNHIIRVLTSSYFSFPAARRLAPKVIHYCKYFFAVWLRARTLSKREPNGPRRSQRNCLSRLSAEGASSGLRRQTWLKHCLPSAPPGLFKSARAPDGWGLRRKTIARVAGCAHILRGSLWKSGFWD